MPCIVFIVSKYTETDNVSELKKALSGTGISVEMRIREDSEYASLIFNYDMDVLRLRKTRNAGRKKACAAITLTCAEVAEMRKTMPESAILDTLQISRSTFYRRLRELDGYPEWFF